MGFEYITQRIRRDATFIEMAEGIENRDGPVNISGLSGSRSAVWIAALAGKYAPMVVVCSNETRAREMLDDLQNFVEGPLYYPPLHRTLYDDMAHNMETEWERIKVLDAMATGNVGLIVTTAEALFFPVMPEERYRENVIVFKTDESCSLERAAERLISAGYEREYMTEGPGRFSIRGGILDIFPPGDISPCRIEFFGDTIDSIRLLDVPSQRSLSKVTNIRIPPCKELLTGPGERREMLTNIDKDLEETAEKLIDSGLETKVSGLEDHISRVKNIIETEPGTRLLKNYWMYGCEVSNIFNYIDKRDKKCLVVLEDPPRIKEQGKKFYEDFLTHYGNRLGAGKALYGQRHRIFEPAMIHSILAQYPGVGIRGILRGPGANYNFPTKTVEAFHGRVPSVVKEVMRLRDDGYLTVLLASSKLRLEALQNELIKSDIFPVQAKGSETFAFPVGTVVLQEGTLKEGFVFPGAKLAVFSDGDIFGTAKKRLKRPSKTKKRGAEFYRELNPGDYVVHENQGIGVYRGIEELKVEGVKRDYLKIEYRNGDMLYLPTYQSHFIQRYVGAEGKRVRISKMGGREWMRTKANVKNAIEDMAKELLQLYAARETARGHAFSEDTPWQKQFDDLFFFEETPDQLQSIEETKRDMERSRPMDRLLCGDVGYGKTEVAMRAAFKAVMDGKQVAMLVPTTILAQQHLYTFRQRMEQFPINIEMLSRFRTPARQREILRLLKEGNVDILIGTHRLLQRDIIFKDLGLLIVDEEQRFGVRHKEEIKRMKKNIDVLTLTATPIPRTLHLSMAGIRDMSVILDPPRDRLPVETFIVEQDEQLIRDAIQKELSRKGQVYFVHNRINSIAKLAAKLRTIVPEASIGVAHGQMDERTLERVMVDFVNKKYDILLCTTIIENGLDMPNVNTIIVTNADRLGLSQMYQLKGRVGRSNRRAYAYFTYKKDKILTEAAEKRLKAIKEFTEFGAGFKIALRDLEIRGAGNILGHEQHGHMMSVGYDLYCKLLDETIKKFKGLPVEQRVETRLDLQVDAYIPDTYIPDENQKVELYRRIASIETDEDYADVYEELKDRFGEPLNPVVNLLLLSHIKSQCEGLGIQDVLQNKNFIIMRFAQKTSLKPEALAAFLSTYRGKVNVKAAKTVDLSFRIGKMDARKLLLMIKGILEEIICFNND